MYQYYIIGCTLLICTVTDIRRRIIKTEVLIISAVLTVLGYAGAEIHEMQELLKGTVPGLYCLAFSWMSREKLGYGDSLLILICGMALGWQRLVSLLLWAFLFAGIYSLGILVWKRELTGEEIPFVPFMLAGFFMILSE